MSRCAKCTAAGPVKGSERSCEREKWLHFGVNLRLESCVQIELRNWGMECGAQQHDVSRRDNQSSMRRKTQHFDSETNTEEQLSVRFHFDFFSFQSLCHIYIVVVVVKREQQQPVASWEVDRLTRDHRLYNLSLSHSCTNTASKSSRWWRWNLSLQLLGGIFLVLI